MRYFRVAPMMMSVAVLALILITSPLGAGQKRPESEAREKVELPPAIAQAVKLNCPNAEIRSVDVEKEAGITLYDIEFKAKGGEIEVAEDGTVMDIATITALKDIPKAAAKAIRKAAPGMIIKHLEKSEVRAEIKKEGAKGTIVKLASPKYLYEAELAKGEQRGEIQVAPDGKIVEGPKWNAEEAEDKESKPAAVDLKILPPAVLSAFKTTYPNAVIKGTSKETEKGITYYEVESVDGKLNRDLLYTADGKAAEIEEAVLPESLPAAVQQALAKAYPGYEILKAEALTKGDQKLFELQIRVKGKKTGVTIDPAGKIIE